MNRVIVKPYVSTCRSRNKETDNNKKDNPQLRLRI